ncbi:hypothetical protein BD780_002674 [Clostridium tetanomorphum]|jgi:hypothetical protein|uniref:hypothetical protein n=1 Tax=Eubacteriales TaxID=186802 RepID=UPI000452679B|nr:MULTISPECIES: hypothetical protein [Eubacteriales]KAJ50639.1 hypothetical protein CTM_16882 [Clostridium tetanomorphum DSM 665]MBP1862712.1 hypothetical protein [Clostridium tetanomorphum]NRS85449.1 hypothetical protein [Clostridium tetanomorphum]SQC02834.1 Uncharacterised protein [Clostridium tetanomorphum]
MKQVGIILGIVVVIVAVFIFVNKSYYPSLPIDNLSAKEAIEKLKNSDEKIVEIATDDDSIWYITKTENEGISIADENIIQMIGSKGWEFKEKDGAGLFFEKDGERLLVTTQMWTKKYVLVQVQNKFKEL